MNLKKTSSALLRSSIKIVVYLIIAVVIYIVLSRAFAFGELILSEDGMTSKGNGVEIQITIPQNATSKEVGDILEKNGLIKNSYAFIIQVILYEADIKPGKYVLNTEYSPKEIIEVLDDDSENNEE